MNEIEQRQINVTLLQPCLVENAGIADVAVIDLRNELLYGVHVCRGYINLEGLHGGFLKTDSVKIAFHRCGLLSHRFVLSHNLLLIIVFLIFDEIQDPLGDNVATRFGHGVVLGYEVLQR